MNTFFSRRERTKRGFTLVETLVYLAITVLIAGVSVSTYLSLDTVLLRIETERALSHAAEVTLERFVRDAYRAEAINTVLSTFNSSTGRVTLVEGTTATTIERVGDHIEVFVNGVSEGPLTPSGVSVNSFIVQRYYTSTSTALVRASLTLSASNKAASSTQTFYASAVLRGSYE